MILTLGVTWLVVLGLLALLRKLLRDGAAFAAGVFTVLAVALGLVCGTVRPWEFVWAVMVGNGQVGDWFPRDSVYHDRRNGEGIADLAVSGLQGMSEDQLREHTLAILASIAEAQDGEHAPTGPETQ